ncbi:MAG TPA: hypothetical protein VJA21_34375 [Verrucomicrobiae bacterium]
MTDWNIQARAHACEACGKPFAHQEPYHTLLFDEKADFRRSDICRGCWEKQYSEGAKDRKGFISYWQGVYEAPAPPAEAIKKETAESLLRKLIELNDPQYIPAGFILAVMLERKRLLKVKEQIVRNGQRVFVYEQPRTGDVFTVVDPNLQLGQLEAVQRDVAALLEHGFIPPGAAPSPASQQTPGTESGSVTPREEVPASTISEDGIVPPPTPT